MTTGLATGLTTVQSHLDAFREVETTLPGHDRPAVARLRRAAIARFGEIGFPTERNEDWKFTSVAPILRQPYQLPSAHRHDERFVGDSPARDDQATMLGIINDNILVRNPNLPAGVRLLGLREALATCPDLVEAHLGQHADGRNHPFVALNNAFWQEGAFLFVPAGVIVEQPIHMIYLAAAHQENMPPRLWYRRNLIILGPGSQATVVERYKEGVDAPTLSNGVSEIVLGEGAILDHYKVQEESSKAFHLATTQVIVPAKATFSTHYIGFGGSLVRNEVRVLFTGQHAEATVNGMYLGSGTQHFDNHTVIDHAQPHCASHELYKGILDGKARGVFNGKIFVRLDAQKTDAKQTNQTLLLSDDATINTKPQLEIYADDVKCTHGATVGQLDDEQLFYLRSRGVGEEQARALLTFAFANDIIRRVKVPSLRQRLERHLLEARHLPRLEEDE